MSKGLILIVDDSELNRLVMSRMLDQLGWSTIEANGGIQALDVLSREAVDVVLMDCEMPDLNGYDTTRELRSRGAAQNGHVPVIAMTGAADDETRGRCSASGMDDFLSKPVDPDELDAMLERWMAE